ncbi:non-specific serine/threonine protein kinase OS=Streptomyces antimycoticus OX=68175 GN=SSPO_052140 PE=3 SV=1 [Streptomyces antimycoticus]
MSIWWSLHLPREAASVPLARRLLLGTMGDGRSLIRRSPTICRVALSPRRVNAGGARGSRHPAGHYRVTAYIDGDTCRIESSL